MRMTQAILATTLMLTTSMTAFADIELRVVKNYAGAASESVWKDVKTDDVPQSLISEVRLRDPSNPYSSLFPKAFYQEEDFLVCFKDCNSSDARKGKEALEQQTVYYWLSKFYQLTKERFDLSPAGRVKVFTTREVRDPGSSKVMRNNAFFNPADGSLSFLPASANPLAALLGAAKLNRSGFDPSVVAHEAGHSLFHALFPNSINNEISGFNEGFADYLANVLLDQPQVGLVMLRGKALRDSASYTDSSNNMKIYVPKLEVHDMGERFAAALWMSRSKVSNKEDFDRLVIDAVEAISKNPFATGHSYKKAFLERAEFSYDSETFRAIKAYWEVFVAGEDRTFSDLSFLKTKVPTGAAFGLRTVTRFPESVSRELGITSETSKFIHIKSVETKDGLTAHLVATEDESVTHPYWVLVDSERGNALGAWYIDGTEIEGDDIQRVASLSTQLMSMNATIEQFVGQAKSFSDLAQGQGELRVAYKVSRHDRNSISLDFAGKRVSAVEHKISLKRRLLARVLLGIPNVKSVSLTTINGIKMDPRWPALEGAPVLGVAMELENGIFTETFFEQVSINN